MTIEDPQASGGVEGSGADVVPSPESTDPTILMKDEESSGGTTDNNTMTSSTTPANAGASARNSTGNPERTYKRKMSISEEAEATSSGRLKPPKFLAYLEKPFQVNNATHHNILGEATGWGMDAAARGPINQVGSFVGAAVLMLATQEAMIDNKCFPKSLDCDYTDNTVKGLKPSSLLTLGSVVVTLSAALLMPIVGSIVDHTRHRKVIGAVTAFLVVAITGAQMVLLYMGDAEYKEGRWFAIFGTEYYRWFAVYILEIIGGFALIVHYTAVLAYLPDLVTSVEEHEEAAHYTSRFQMLQFASQATFSIIVVGISYGQDLDNQETAALGLAICFPFSAILMAYSWTFLFRKRPPLIEKPEGTSVVTAGFIQLARTTKKIAKRYHALRWLMISLLWSPEAGAGVVLSIAVTFLVQEIEMTGAQIGLVSFIMLSCNIPGSFWAKFVMKKINPLNSFRSALLFFATMVAGTVATVDSPENKDWVYFWAATWGIAFGWLYPSQRTLFVTMTPKGQETEIMGLFTFAGQILGWMPPVIFTIMNENGVDMRWGMSLISFFLGLSFVCTMFIGEYKTALAQVAADAEEEALEEKDAMNGEEEEDSEESFVVNEKEENDTFVDNVKEVDVEHEA